MQWLHLNSVWKWRFIYFSAHSQQPRSWLPCLRFQGYWMLINYVFRQYFLRVQRIPYKQKPRFESHICVLFGVHSRSVGSVARVHRRTQTDGGQSGLTGLYHKHSLPNQEPLVHRCLTQDVFYGSIFGGHSQRKVQCWIWKWSSTNAT